MTHDWLDQIKWDAQGLVPPSAASRTVPPAGNIEAGDAYTSDGRAITLAAAAGVATIAVTPSGTVYKGSTLSIAVDFPTGTYTEGTWGQYPYLSLFTSTTGVDGPFTRFAPGVKSSSAGLYTFSYTVGNDQVWIKAGNDTDHLNGIANTLYNDPTKQIFTSVVKLDPQDAPPAGIVLDQPAAAAKTFTATFTGAAFKSGQSSSLQLLTILTSMTAEVTNASWKTVATASESVSL